MLESETRLIPHAQWEIQWAHERAPHERTPLPVVGDEVLYRHDPWAEPLRAEVLQVQSPTDLDDPHLWRVQTDGLGRPVLIEGKPVLQARFDPWPVLRLRVPGIGMIDTREARLRGSPGWLPLDWETRFRPMPEFLIVSP